MEARGKRQDMPKRIIGLTELAYNFWWSWHPDGRMLFKRLSRTAWKINKHNPVKMLCEIDKDTLEKLAKDPIFLKSYDVVMDKFNEYLNNESSWFLRNFSKKKSNLSRFFLQSMAFIIPFHFMLVG